MEQLLTGTVENAKRQVKKGAEMSGQEWLLFLMVSFFLPLVFLFGFMKADYRLLLVSGGAAISWALYIGWNTFCRKRKGYVFEAREEVMKELYPDADFSRVLFKKYCRLNERERKAELKAYFPDSVFMSIRGELYYYEGTLQTQKQGEKIQVHGFTGRQICELYDDTACYYYDYAIFERKIPKSSSLYGKDGVCFSKDTQYWIRLSQKEPSEEWKVALISEQKRENRWLEKLSEVLNDKEWTMILDQDRMFVVVRSLPLDKCWEDRLFVKEEVEEHAKEVKKILTAFSENIE